MKQGWEYKKLGEVTTFPNKRISLKEISAQEYVGVETLVKDKGGVCFSNEKPNADSAIEFIENDILVGNIRPYLKKIWKSDRHGGASGDVINIRITDDFKEYLEPSFLYCILSSDAFFDYDNANTHGAKMPRGDKQAISEYKIPLPPLSTQQSIVAELDEINNLLSLKRKELETYDKLAQSVFYEMFGNPVENEKEWEVKKLGEVCECITDGDHMPPPKSETGIPFVTIGNVNKKTRQIDFDNTYFVPKEYFHNIPETKKPRRGDVLYTVTGSYGIPIIIDYDKEFCFQRHIGLLRPKDIVNSIYLCMWAGNDSTKGQADLVATGIAQKTVSLRSLRNFDIILPPLPLQQTFAARIEAIEEQKASVKAAIEKLETLLAARMQYWFE